MNHKSIILYSGSVSVILLFLQLLWPSTIFADITWEDIKDEAVASWNTVASEYKKGIELTMTLTNPKGIDTVYLAVKDQCQMYQCDYKVGGEAKDFGARNSRYQFYLVRQKNDSPWTMTDLTTDLATERERSQYHHDLFQLVTYIFEPLMIENQWLSEIFQSDKVKIEKIEQHGDSNQLITLHFVANDYFADKNLKLIRGFVVLDQSNFYLIDHYDVESEFIIPDPKRFNSPVNSMQLKRKTRIEYTRIGELPYAKLCDTQFDAAPNEIKGYIKFPDNNFEKMEYHDIKTKDEVSDSIFYLSNYGFPEPEDPNRKYNLFRLLLAIIGVGLIGTGLYMRLKGINKTKTQL